MGTEARFAAWAYSTIRIIPFSIPEGRGALWRARFSLFYLQRAPLSIPETEKFLEIRPGRR